MYQKKAFAGFRDVVKLFMKTQATVVIFKKKWALNIPAEINKHGKINDYDQQKIMALHTSFNHHFGVLLSLPLTT
jgi:hypothetical protein